ncbi:MAG: hypothetical protein RIR00_1731, partial [Pseudomonadota bacterium]
MAMIQSRSGNGPKPQQAGKVPAGVGMVSMANDAGATAGQPENRQAQAAGRGQNHAVAAQFSRRAPGAAAGRNAGVLLPRLSLLGALLLGALPVAAWAQSGAPVAARAAEKAAAGKDLPKEAAKESAGWLSSLLGGKASSELPSPGAFSTSMELGNLDQATLWLDAGLPPDFLGSRIGSGLMIGAWEGNLKLMELFLSRGADINAVNRDGEQAVALAAWRGQKAALQWLLDHGAKLNRDGLQWGALHYAALAGHGELVRQLIDQGADLNARAPNGSSPL